MKERSLFLLVVVYLAFVCLGLPDTVLGVAWPAMRRSFGLDVEAAGVFTIVTTLGTALSSLLAGYVLPRLGTGKVAAASGLLVAVALVGYALAPALGWMLASTIPLGLGAGAIDTRLNNFAATHWSARHMSWLHCFWGVGASVGPMVMSASLASNGGWRLGYMLLGIVQLSVALLLLATLRLWPAEAAPQPSAAGRTSPRRPVAARTRVVVAVASFPVYIGVEMGTSVWLPSYLIGSHAMSPSQAGLFTALFFSCLTIGRFAAGVLAERVSSRTLIRYGLAVALCGAVLLNLPWTAAIAPAVVLLGFGCAPVFPSMIHETPRLFGAERSATIIGLQIGLSYLSGVALVPLVGLLAQSVTLRAIPLSLGVWLVAVLLLQEYLGRLPAHRAEPSAASDHEDERQQRTCHAS